MGERKCIVCGEGTTYDKGTPAKYDKGYAHVDCAYKMGFGDTQQKK